MQGLGLYIHWPFCIKKCYYCDLNSHVRDYDDYKNFADALIKELEKWRQELKGIFVQTVFFGGGTPSLMRPEWVAELLSIVRDWNSDNSMDIEITLEANPTSTEFHNLYGFYRAGVNRISFGAQTFNDDHLKKLGRTHTADQARSIIRQAKEIFPKVSVDLMYNLPGQTPDQVQADLTSAMELQVKHISYYALTIHENTNFGSLYREQKLHLPNEDVFCDSYDLIAKNLAAYGMSQYEISNFCFPGNESQHNLIYWNYKPFLGIGPGAHSRLFRNGKVEAVSNYKVPEKWLNSIQNEEQSYELEYLDTHIQKKEELLMKLRLSNGLNKEEIGRLLPESAWDRATTLVNLGDMWTEKDSFGLTSNGFLKYNAILKYLTLDLN